MGPACLIVPAGKLRDKISRLCKRGGIGGKGWGWRTRRGFHRNRSRRGCARLRAGVRVRAVAAAAGCRRFTVGVALLLVIIGFALLRIDEPQWAAVCLVLVAGFSAVAWWNWRMLSRRYAENVGVSGGAGEDAWGGAAVGGGDGDGISRSWSS